jgi:hypothetical protein
MSEENKVAQPTNENTEATTTEATETKTEETKTFTQSQLDNMIASRVMAERNKYEKKIAEEETKKQELLKQKELEEAKSKQEVEKIMQQRLAEKEAEINKIKTEVKAERIDKQILAIASTNKAVNPEQVVSLLKSRVQLSEDNRVEVLDQNGNIRYNEKGQPLSVEEQVKEFLDTNPHFRQGSLSGSGSQSSIGGNSQKPRSIGDLDLNNPSDRKVYAEMRKQRQGFTLNPKLTINN